MNGTTKNLARTQRDLDVWKRAIAASMSASSTWLSSSISRSSAAMRAE